MSSRIEQMIDDIEGYIESCKYAAFSSTKIIVEKEELGELLAELRAKTPEEIKRYQKIISHKEDILSNAQDKAQQILQQVEAQSAELISEHQIMQQAYQQANEVVELATKQAQEILDTATNEANSLRMNAVIYMDEQLSNIQKILSGSLSDTRARNEGMIASLQGYLNVINSNRAEIAPMMGKEESKSRASEPEEKPEASGTEPQPAKSSPDNSKDDQPEGFSEVDVEDQESILGSTEEKDNSED